MSTRRQYPGRSGAWRRGGFVLPGIPAEAGHTGFLDAGAKKPAPDLDLAVDPIEALLTVDCNTHIHNTLDRRAMSSKIQAGLD
jgi:hypothetical protein